MVPGPLGAGVAFNRYCRLRVTRWDPDGVEIVLPYTETLSAHEGLFHGGVVSALIDTAGAGAVIAGHDFTKGSRLSTVSMSVQYLAPPAAGRPSPTRAVSGGAAGCTSPTST